jgi:uncharacterized delta-60 repeat protein
MQKLSKHTQALLALSCALALILISGRPLPVVKAGESNGSLDASFGANGKVTTDLGSVFDQALSIASQPNGKIVAAGAAWSGAGYDFALARYNRDGSLDDSFGVAGKVTTDFAGYTDMALSVAVQPDGKIVAAGFASVSGAGFNFALARYNRDGSPDASFGANGKVTTDFAGYFDQARSVSLQPDGKIVAAGFALSDAGYDFALARYNRDGSLDDGFGANGKVTTDFESVFDQAFSLALQPDGKIVAAGFALGDSGNDFALARYNRDGSLDDGFGDDGKVTTDFAGSIDQAFSVAVQPNGKIVAAGLAYIGESNFALARYNRDGSLDDSFGDDGKVTTSFAGYFDEALSVVVQPDGKIVAAGLTLASGADNDFALARYNRDGSLDDGFGVAGKVTTDFAGAGDVARSVALQPDGKIVVAGYAAINGAQDFALARYE